MTQAQYKRNLRLINWLAAFNNASFFVPFAVPFWLESGLNQQKIYLLQGVFTLVMIGLEIPTGIISDRVGRRISLIAAGLLAATGFGVYAVSNGFWQFAVAETLLAIGLSLNSGTIQSMRHESTVASGNGHLGRKTAGTAHAAALFAAAASAALSGLAVKYWGFRTTMILDGLTYLVTTSCALRMVEPPRTLKLRHERAKVKAIWPAISGIAGLIGLFALLREATHIPVFLNARLLELADINIGWFGVIFGSLSLVGALVSRHGYKIEAKLGDRKTALMLVFLGITSYLATSQLPAVIAPFGIVGFSVMFALTKPFMDHALNSRIHDDRIRATLNSCATLVSRVLYLIAGPLIGGVVDGHGIQVGYLVTGLCFGTLSLGALMVTFNQLEGRK